jgi:ADP-heptose:LPS heptosyltransferase
LKTEFKKAVALDWDGPEILNFVDELKDFADTAALVMNLDLVISVDTATAHLSASLGKPVWLLTRYDACWRWGLDREDCPWYPSLKIYRQPSLGDWETVIQRVRQDLLAWCVDQH